MLMKTSTHVFDFMAQHCIPTTVHTTVAVVYNPPPLGWPDTQSEAELSRVGRFKWEDTSKIEGGEWLQSATWPLDVSRSYTLVL